MCVCVFVWPDMLIDSRQREHFFLKADVFGYRTALPYVTNLIGDLQHARPPAEGGFAMWQARSIASVKLSEAS